MKSKRVFNEKEVLAEAKAGSLRGAELRKAIKIAEEFGRSSTANELKLFLVDPASFAGDKAPVEVRNRVAEGVRSLTRQKLPLPNSAEYIQLSS